MLTIANVKATRQAAHYYEASDGYYTSDDDESPSAWHGKGAEELGLSGEVAPHDFVRLLEGQVTETDRIHNAGAGRRGGTDLTFSAPKSVSIEALVKGDHRVLEAHQEAVRRTLDYAEQIVHTRGTNSHAPERTGRAVMATFLHDTNRASEPNLHTHAIVINATRTEDGTWRAIDNGPLYERKMMLGAFYRNELALQLRALGFDIRMTKNDGQFELAHYTHEQIRQFSSRSADIEAALAAKGLDRETASAELKKAIAVATRDAKKDLDRPSVYASWREKARSMGIDMTPHQIKGDGTKIDTTKKTKEAVDYALRHLSEREAVFEPEEVLTHAIQYATGYTTQEQVYKEIRRRIGTRELYAENGYLTRNVDLRAELRLSGIAIVGQRAQPMLAKEDLAKRLQGSILNDGQRKAVELVVASDRAIVGVRGDAGTGKTTMLKAVQEIAIAEDFRLVGLGPSRRAAQEMTSVGIDSRTISKFLLDEDLRASINSRTVLVMDESGMVPTHHMKAVLEIAQSRGARVVMMGDEKQLKAIESGKPFEMMASLGMPIERLHENVRQASAPEHIRNAVDLAAAGQIAKSVSELTNDFKVFRDAGERHAAMAGEFLSKDEDARAKTIILTGSNRARKSLNDEIRKQLIDREELGASSGAHDVLTRVDVTTAQARRALSYSLGMVIEAQRAYKSLGVEKGDRMEVVGAKGPHILQVRHEDGRSIDWQPSRHVNFTVYQVEKRELRIGDRIEFTKNMDFVKEGEAFRQIRPGEHQPPGEKLEIGNRESGQVVGFDSSAKTLRIKTERGTVDLPTSRALHAEYGYAKTMHSAQGATYESVIAEFNSKSGTTDRSSYYVAISRAKRGISPYTDDLDELRKELNKEFKKSSSVEMVRGEMPSRVRGRYVVGVVTAQLEKEAARKLIAQEPILTKQPRTKEIGRDASPAALKRKELDIEGLER